MPAPADEDRYSRQILFRPLGQEGQQRLSEAHAVIVGIGATGAATAGLLARAGVGHLTLIDRDFVEPSNLQRQVLFDEADAAAALPKAEAARRHIAAFNSGIQVTAHVADLVPGNIHDLLAGADILLDGTDNFETRFLLNDYAVSTGTPWIYAAAVGSYAATMNILPRAGSRKQEAGNSPEAVAATAAVLKGTGFSPYVQTSPEAGASAPEGVQEAPTKLSGSPWEGAGAFRPLNTDAQKKGALAPGLAEAPVEFSGHHREGAVGFSPLTSRPAEMGFSPGFPSGPAAKSLSSPPDAGHQPSSSRPEAEGRSGEPPASAAARAEGTSPSTPYNVERTTYNATEGPNPTSYFLLPTSCLSCLFPAAPQGDTETCDTAGILSTAVNFAASLQATEALKFLSGNAAAMRRTLLTYDLWTGERSELSAAGPDPGCEVCGQRKFRYLAGENRPQITLCGRNSVQIHEHNRPVDLAALRARLEPLGEVRANGLLLRFKRAPHTLTVFPDGRALIQGTTDVALARSLYARFIGS